MKCEKVDLVKTGAYPEILLDYAKQDPRLKPFYQYPPEPGSFKDILDKKKFSSTKRKILQEVLNDQYKTMPAAGPVTENIKTLGKDKTFTVTTGHQLNIFTGPLYFIYKIITVINTCNKLKDIYPEYSFVPVYWMASEDHDLEEISSFTLFGENYIWNTGQTGPVGRMDPGSLKEIIDKLPEKIELFEKAYTEQDSLANAVRYYMNELFGKDGLVVIDADEKRLKELFKEIMKDDLTDHHANDLVEETSSELGKAGFNAQVYPRAINLFYMKDHLRGRIVREKETYQVLDTDLSFTYKEIIKLIDESPELFSPNVILRPLYQETILPNIAYVGGPAEVAYWLQLKAVFEFYKIDFPVVLPRNFAMIVGKSLNKKLSKLSVTGSDLFRDFNELKVLHLEELAENSFSLEKEKRILNEVYESIKNKTMAVNKSLEGFIGAERARLEKSIENIEKRLVKEEERKQDTSIKQLQTLKEKLFPGEGLQERHENFLTFYLNDPEFIGSIRDQFDPFDFRFNICYEE